MVTIIRCLAFVCLALPLVGADVAAPAASPGTVAAATTPAVGTVLNFAGTYRWGNKEACPLRAVYTKAADGTWTAVFTAVHKGKDYIYRGSLAGDPNAATGTSGTAADTQNKRRWRFTVAVQAGALAGEHFETTKNPAGARTGIFSLTPVR